MKGKKLEWKVNTAALLKEALECGGPAMSIMKIPFNVFKEILVKVGERAAEINDSKLNALMARLAIYAETDPYSEEFNQKICNDCLAEKTGQDVVEALKKLKNES